MTSMMLAATCRHYVTIYLVLSCFFQTSIRVSAFDDDDETTKSHDHLDHDPSKPLPKDKVLLRDVKTLTFQRNRRTTSRRTHPMHQLACVGGTAGCKLFTPNEVQCENLGFNSENRKFEWKCSADMSDRVTFNHVDVICEGYDYPEDSYILLGSCGLEFTLDYTDPHDYHHHSYFKHMDEHEKKLHHDRIKQTSSKSNLKSTSYSDLFDPSISGKIIVGSILLLIFCVFTFFSRFLNRPSGSGPSNQVKKSPFQRGSSYGPLTSAVLSTKKAC